MWVRFPPPPPSRPSAGLVGSGRHRPRRSGPRWTSRLRSIPGARRLGVLHAPPPSAQPSRVIGDRRRRASDARDLRRHCVALHRERAGSKRCHPWLARSPPGCRRARWSWTLARGRGLTPSNSGVAGSAPSASTSRWACCARASRSTRARVCRRMRGGCPSAPALLRASGRARRCSTSRDRTRLLALEDARRTLAPSGRLLVSVKQGNGCETETARYGMPRFFRYLVRLRARRGARCGPVPRHRWRRRKHRRAPTGSSGWPSGSTDAGGGAGCPTRPPCDYSARIASTGASFAARRAG